MGDSVIELQVLKQLERLKDENGRVHGHSLDMSILISIETVGLKFVFVGFLRCNEYGALSL